MAKEADPNLSIPDDQDLKDVKDLMGPTPEDAEAGAVETSEEEPLPELQNDTTTSEAIEDIVAKESSELIEAQDEKLAASFTKKPSLWARMKSWPAAWWHNKKARNLTFLGLFLLTIALFLIPPTRYFLLNTFGVRASSSVTVLDESTGQPIKKAEVTIGDKSALTDQDGKATLSDLKLGDTKLKVVKRSYAELEQSVTIGWGSNPFEPFELKPTGSQYTFIVTDALSAKPIEKAEISQGDSSAFSDKDGKAVLSIDPGDGDSVEVVAAFKSYRDEKITVPASQKDPVSVGMVAAKPDIFMSKRSGKYDIYRIDADGKNETLLLAGSGKERDNMTLSVSPDRSKVAFVSTRSGKTNTDGYAVETLLIIDLDSKETEEVMTTEQIRLIGWINSTIVYVGVASAGSAAAPEREKLMSYDTNSDNGLQIATSNMFNDVAIMGDKVFYAQSNIYGDNPNANLTRVSSNGTDKSVVLNRQTWSLIRTAYDEFQVSTVGNKWYSYKDGASAATEIQPPPSVPRDRSYVNNPSNSKSAWYDYRDGKGVVVLWDINGKADSVLYSRGGLTTPLQWLDDTHLLFRIATNQETADYVISTDGGEAKKVVDVVDIHTDSNQYFY